MTTTLRRRFLWTSAVLLAAVGGGCVGSTTVNPENRLPLNGRRVAGHPD